MDVMPERTPSMVAAPPAVGRRTVSRLLLETYGVTARLTELRSERDRNFLAGADLVVKVSNSGDDAGQIAMECAAMQHLAAVAPDLAIPRLLPTADGAPIATLEADDGRIHQVRVITVLPGADADLTALPSWFAAEFGTVCAEFARALQGFGHPAAYRKLDWDPRRVVDLASYVDRVP
ncbi:MAG: phosphotransferase, partial [Kribbellaceae bacterium]|nr:phosphotransferase [Kribbellaceae bacterium]